MLLSISGDSRILVQLKKLVPSRFTCIAKRCQFQNSVLQSSCQERTELRGQLSEPVYMAPGV